MEIFQTTSHPHVRILSNFTQEEDFVSNLYHRSLLTNIDVAEIYHTISEALSYVSRLKNISITLRDALVIRLELRNSFLSAVQFDEIINDHRVPWWDRCLELIPSLPNTTSLGTRVEASFSIKIQRRLASTVPPRPIVNISFDGAIEQLTRLCQNGKEAYRILDYHGGDNLMVSALSRLSMYHLNSPAAIHMGVSIAYTTANRLHPVLNASNGVQRNAGVGHDVL